MLNTILGLFGRVDKFVGPVYRVIFVATAVVAALTWCTYQALPFLTEAYNWVDSRISDIGPIVMSPASTTRLLISLLFGVAGGSASILGEYAKTQRVRLQITDEIRRCTASHIKYYDELFTLLANQGSVGSEPTMEMISEISRNHSIFLCSRLAEIFTLVTRCPCHASIKTFNSETGLVTTRTRDALMQNHDRSTADDFRQSYPFEANTAFQRILTDPAAELYLNNYLRLSAWLGRYQNGNPGWSKDYRATAVAPLTGSRSAATITRDTVIGFVCVDNRCGRFPRRYSRAVLGVFVVFIHDMTEKLGEIQAS